MIGYILLRRNGGRVWLCSYLNLRAIAYIGQPSNTRVANKCGLPPSYQHLWALLERFNLKTCSFFTPVSELRMVMHETEEVLGLHHGNLPQGSMWPQRA